MAAVLEAAESRKRTSQSLMASHNPKAKHSQIQYKICKHMQEAAGQCAVPTKMCYLEVFKLAKNMALKDK
jgi:hypothetical protein